MLDQTRTLQSVRCVCVLSVYVQLGYVIMTCCILVHISGIYYGRQMESLPLGANPERVPTPASWMQLLKTVTQFSIFGYFVAHKLIITNQPTGLFFTPHLACLYIDFILSILSKRNINFYRNKLVLKTQYKWQARRRGQALSCFWARTT